MPEPVLNKSKCLENLPLEWNDDLLPGIRKNLEDSGRKIVVLDDDPTGTQTVYDLAVLTTWSVKTLEQELKKENNCFYILTNSRSLSESGAVKLGTEIGENLKKASQNAGTGIIVISRSDSTLRGHFPGEVKAVAKAMGIENLPFLIVPFFPEGGRYTIDNIHYVAEKDKLVPAAQTSYAQDQAFGYKNSDLTKWVEEKTGGRIPASQVAVISIDDLRKKGPEHVAQILSQVEDNSACIVNAASYSDLEVLVGALQKAGQGGRSFLYRTAASFVRVMAGIAPKAEMITSRELTVQNSHGGLFVAGSYVPKTTEQIENLIEQTGISVAELNVPYILDSSKKEQEIDRIISKVNSTIKSGKDVLVCTSRELVKGHDSKSGLEIGRQVSDSIIQIIQNIKYQPRYIVAKGGITSSEIATKGLGVKRAMVMGQILPGIPAWRLGKETRYPDTAYIVFPGNVGETGALTKIKNNLSK